MKTCVKSMLYFLLFSCFSCSYLPEAIVEDENLKVEENADYISLTSAATDMNKSGIIFYPGGLVDPHAYINPLKDFALEEDRMVIILKVPSNLAILNTEKASDIIQDFPEITSWFLGGHSLGGATACIDISKNPDNFAGLFLLAAYSSVDISEVDIPMISITGSDDGVLNIEEFSLGKDRLPPEVNVSSLYELATGGTLDVTIYYEINGGNHAQFANYGDQKGDNEASISSETQQSLTYQILSEFLIVNQL